jgi:intermembrane space import and assembly protein 40
MTVVQGFQEETVRLDVQGLKEDEGIASDNNDGLQQEEEAVLVVVPELEGVAQTEETDKCTNDAAAGGVKEGGEYLHEEKKPEEEQEGGGKEEGEEEECGFCLFMKAGPCGKRFSQWEKCVEEAESTGTNIVEKCAPVTHLLKDCMELHPEYYGPVLQAEKAMEAQSAIEAAAAAANKEEARESGSTEAHAKLPA